MKTMELPEKEFLNVSSKLPLINVDLLIVNEFGEVIFSWRDDEYCGTRWHISGGIIRNGELMKTRLELDAIWELGFIPELDAVPCKITEIFLNQEHRNHFISHLFKGRCKKTDVNTVGCYQNHHVGDLCWFDH